MARKGAKPDPYAKRAHETHLEWRSRITKMEQDERDKKEPIVPVHAQAHGDYLKRFIVHQETNTIAETACNRASHIVDKWFAEGWPGFEEPARAAINRCAKLWEVRPVVGKLTAAYEPTVFGGAPANDYGILSALDDNGQLERWQALFHPAHWEVFEAVVRWGNPAGVAGSEMANNTPQSIASARAIVGLVANVIAMQRGC